MIIFALNPDATNLDYVLKELDRYFKKKQELDTTDRFNFCAFETNGPIYYEDFLFDPSFIVDALRDMKSSLVRPNLAGGLFIAVTFIIDVFKAVGGKLFRLILLTDRATPLLNNVEVVQNLLDQVLEFPLFVDFVRIGTEDPREDLKLMKFAKKNGGSVFFAKTERDIGKIFDSLIEKKKIPKVSDDGKYTISLENEPFFVNLAQDPWVVENQEAVGKVCQICRSGSGELVKCPKCNSINHPECLAQWAKMSNIGLPYLFRCMSCYNLLRLPADFAHDVQSGEYKKRMQIEAANQTALLRQKERATTPQLKLGADPLAGMGFEEMDTSSSFDEGWDMNGSEDFKFQRDDTLQIQFCDSCGSLNMPEVLKCTKCGKKLR
jgi:ribosomal protein L40E